MPTTPLSQKALDLILQFEGGGGIDQPSVWPGNQSGITLGYGYDLGYNTPDQFAADWSAFLTPAAVAQLKTVVGLKGTAAQARAKDFVTIKIKEPDARQVLVGSTVPRYYDETKKAFPGLDKIPPDAQGALVSLVFNRGTAMDGPRRTEMRTIQTILATPKPDLHAIALQLRSMKRLWPTTPGLQRRRDAEADLVEQSIVA